MTNHVTLPGAITTAIVIAATLAACPANAAAGRDHAPEPPAEVGAYRYLIVVDAEEKETGIYHAPPQFFHGARATKFMVARPPDGWSWDWRQGADAFKQSSHDGNRSACMGVQPGLNPDGVTHAARLDGQIYFIKLANGDSKTIVKHTYRNCAVSGPITRMRTSTVSIPLETGIVSRSQSVHLAIPANAKATILEITTFDGRKLEFRGPGSDAYFDVVQDAREIIIQPKIPAGASMDGV